MSATKSKGELVRLAWIAALRREGHRQCHGTKTDGPGRACALMLLSYIKRDLATNSIVLNASLVANLTAQQACEIIMLNDGRRSFNGYTLRRKGRGRIKRHTFAEIADVVESWFPDAGAPRSDDFLDAPMAPTSA